MSTIAQLIQPISEQSADDIYLGPARVTQAGTREVELALESGEQVAAQLALALPYAAVEDDVVLVLGRGGRHYVIGVLDGHGKTALNFRGDVQLRALGGSLRLEADEEVTVRGRKLSLEAIDFKMTAENLVQRAQSAYQRVRDLLSVHAKRTTTVVDETILSKSRSATLLTEETMTINGEQIHLG